METKKHEKHKKHKKEKKRRKEKSSSSSESSSEDEKMEWVEASTSSSSSRKAKEKREQREDWMQEECFVPTYSKRESQTKKKRLAKSEEELQREKKILEERELNPYLKDNGMGPRTNKSSKSNVQSHSVGDGGYSWLKKAYQRIQEQSAEEGRSMEEIAAERWGSLEKLKSMLKAAEENLSSSVEVRKDVSRNESRSDRVTDKMAYDGNSRKNREKYSSRYSSSDRSHSPSEHKRERTRDKQSPSRTDYHRHHTNDSPEHDDRQHHKFHAHHRSSSRDIDSHQKYKLNYHSSRYQRRSRSERESDFQHKSSRSKSPDNIAERKHRDYDRDSEVNRREGRRKSSESPNHHRQHDVENREYAWDRKSNDSRPTERSVFRKPDESDNRKNIHNPESSIQPSWKKKIPTKSTLLESKFVSSENETLELKFPDTEDSSNMATNSSSSKPMEVSSHHSGGSSEESTSSESENEDSKPREDPILNDNELNYLAARALRASMFGDSELAAKIEQDLESSKKRQEEYKASGGQIFNGFPREQVLNSVIDRYPLPKGFQSVLPVKHGKSDNKIYVGAPKTKYFDDKMSLQSIFEREKMTSVDDQLKMYIDAASSRKETMDEECHEDVSGKTAEKMNKYVKPERDMHKAIQDYKHLSFALDRCRFCLNKPSLPKHSIIGKGDEVFLCCPSFKSLVEGHCFIVPVTHVSSTLLLDENEYSEVQAFKRGVMKMFRDQGKNIIFLEISIKQRFYPHAVIECIPVPKDVWDVAPLYFKKAIDESEHEWSHNKKLIDLSKKGIRYSVPKGLPFFSVDFGDGTGFAHVIEDDRNFPRHFGREIVGGMLEMDSYEIKERADSTEGICEKTLKLVNIFEKYKEYFKC